MSVFAGLIGSLRKQSYNRMVFNHYRGIVAQDGDELVEGVIRDFPLYDDDVKAAGFPPSAEALAEQIRKADGVIFFTPEYNFSIPGGLKNALDWLSRFQDQPLAGKPAAIVSASPGKLGGARMQYHLRQIGVFLDLRFLNKPEAMVSEVNKKFDASGKMTDVETDAFLKKHFAAFKGFALRR